MNSQQNLPGSLVATVSEHKFTQIQHRKGKQNFDRIVIIRTLVKRSDKFCQVSDLGSCTQSQFGLWVNYVPMNTLTLLKYIWMSLFICKTKIQYTCSRSLSGVKGQFKGPSGAFVTYCNISCFCHLFKGRQLLWLSVCFCGQQIPKLQSALEGRIYF